MSSYFPLETTLWVLCILQSMFYISCGCVPEERAALLHVRFSLMEVDSELLPSWGDRQDCCSWERVTCNNDDIARVSGLDLSDMYDGPECWNLNLAAFSQFHELQLLDLSWNHYACLHNFEGI